MSTVHTQLDRNAGGSVAVLTIANPPVNAMSMAVRADLIAAVQGAVADPEVQALVLIGAGGRFIPGADIREFGKPISGPSGRDVIAAIEASPKPIVAALGGNALGGGLEVALGCHFRIAAPDCRLGLPEVNLGLIPGEGGTQFAGRIMGPSRALLYMVTGESFGPEKATELGLFDELVEADEVEQKALAFAHKCADGPSKAIGFMKLALTEGLDLPMHEAFAYERHLQNQLFDTPDSKEGVRAFLEKRAPRWGQTS